MTRASLPERIANRLRRDILRGTLTPGETIKERDNASSLGVSRTPMREAIRILAREGLVLLRPTRSPVVAHLSLKQVTDAAEVMAALEVLSGRLACLNATAAELAQIRSLFDRHAASFATADMLDLFEIDMAFHRAIAQASRNAALAETHGAYLARLWRARYLSARERASRDGVLHQHGLILDALDAHDPDRAAAAIDAHLRDFVARIITFYETGGSAGAAAEHETGTRDIG